MSIRVINLRSIEGLPPGFTEIVSGVNASYLFKITDAEKDKFVIYADTHCSKLNFNDIKNGKTSVSVVVVIDSNTVSDSKKSIYIRSLVKRISGVAGVSIKEELIYVLPQGVISSLYAGATLIQAPSRASGLMKALGGGEDVAKVEDKETQIVESFIEFCRKAYEEKASDIHFILDEDGNTCTIQYRINSELEYASEPVYEVGLAMCRAAYSSKADPTSRSHVTFNERERQDARIVLTIDGVKVAFRFASTPTSIGSLCVLRILPIGLSTEIKTLEQLGYMPSQARMIESMMRKPIGALIVAGVTGSGKSTTLKTLLEQKIRENPDKRAITIEQPVEYLIRNAIQIPVGPASKEPGAENPFVAAIKTAMRLDPDTLMIGEVRDDVTADLLASATESGHAVLTTVHASSALEIITRLTGQAMKLPIDTISSMSFIAGLIYQKLSPVICVDCRIPLDVNEFLNSEDNAKIGLIERLQMVTDFDENDIYIRNHDGCECCRKGVTGVEVCAETILPDLKMRGYWKDRNDVAAYEHWRSTRDPRNAENGQGRTALEVAIYKMNKGLMCPVNIEKIFGNINEDAVLEDGVRTYKEV